jgi:hypothetical protein
MLLTPTSVRSFPREDERNSNYTYIAGPKKEVVLMGNRAFANLLASIQAQIGTLNNTVSVLERRVATYTRKVQEGGPNAAQAASDLAATEADKTKKQATIEDLKNFFVELKKEWSELNDRVIGYVVWAPPISVSNPPHGYTKDVCVIKLDEKKFSRNFKGNVTDLGAC